MRSQRSLSEIRQSDEYRGRWIAVDNCSYDARTARPIEGTVVDVDDDLVELCKRVRQRDNKHCVIVLCEGADEPGPPPSSGRTPPTPLPPVARTRAH